MQLHFVTLLAYKLAHLQQIDTGYSYVVHCLLLLPSDGEQSGLLRNILNSTLLLSMARPHFIQI